MSAAAQRTQAIDLMPETIPQEHIDNLARPLIEIVTKAFEDPAFAAEFEIWLAEREKRIKS